MLAYRTVIRKSSSLPPQFSRFIFPSALKMSTSAALYTSETLKAANAPSFGTMHGRLDPELLHALREMKFDFMTPVQEKVMNELPTLRSDW